jgi:rod shape-determining protein MreD
MNNFYFNHIISFFVLVLVQAVVLNQIDLGGYINPYLYILFILGLPFETPKWLLMLLGFLLGICLDAFTDTLGIHASACTFLATIRPMLLKLIAPRDGYEAGQKPAIGSMGLTWFLKYVIILTLLHHFWLFFIEGFRANLILINFWRTILSSLFTIILIILVEYLTMNKKRGVAR